MKYWGIILLPGLGNVIMKQEQHIAIPFRVLKSKEYWNLKSYTRDILHLFLMNYYPDIPDKGVGLAYSQIKAITGHDEHMISKSLKELKACGYIKLKSKGFWKSGECSKYIINPMFKLQTSEKAAKKKTTN